MTPDIKITIVGGGIGGLALGIMLEAAQIDYVILERSSCLRTMGSTIAMNACSLRLLEQLGLWPEVQKIAKPIGAFHLKNEELSSIGSIDFSFGEKHYGYHAYVMSRPELFELLRSRVPKSKVLLQKNVVDVIEDDRGVLCKCYDGSEYWSDLLVGADGAYSQVRKLMYDQLRQENQLSPTDDLPLKFTHHCVLGVSEALNPTSFPVLKDKFSKFEIMLFSERRCSLWMSPVEGNKISWCFGGELDQDMKYALGSSETKNPWGKTAIDAQQLLDEICNMPTVYGCNVGDIINTTPKEKVSSVLLEEKFFETWHTKRIVLLGDACHKLLPFAGQGAIHAMLDGLCLANLLHDLQSTGSSDIEQMLRTYHQQRSGSARSAVVGSRLFGLFMVSKSFLARWTRSIALNLLPHWLTRTVTDMVMRNRPQLSYLPMIEDRGIVKAW
ncbi:hypothetical protein B0O80DRAFT_525432 [Mortierella sp. GBAus27b]|nr:hypothetical protein BGX31_008518 [Mortierella sp. GBA43]KAI8361628.1 hypothetical protein B0O80DRAFT_525432 [Mortierella sp. GBAus27b]